MGRYLMGYDVGSSSIKATLMETETGRAVASATSPADELEIMAPQPGWAEQHPDTWWENIAAATAEIGRDFDLQEVDAVGVAYQMHGLVAVDKGGKVLRPSIIWCDSRAVELGDRADAEGLALRVGEGERQVVAAPVAVDPDLELERPRADAGRRAGDSGHARRR